MADDFSPLSRVLSHGAILCHFARIQPGPILKDVSARKGSVCREAGMGGIDRLRSEHCHCKQAQKAVTD